MRNLISSAALIGCLLLSVSSCKDDEPSPPPAAVFEYQITKEMTTGSGLSVFTTPTITFNNAIQQSVSVEDNTYKPVIDEIRVYKETTELPGTYTLSTDSRSAKFIPTAILPSESSIKMVVKSHWEVQLNGEWSTITNSGQLSLQTSEGIFSTGKYAPPSELIVKQLPVNGSVGLSTVTYPLIVFKKSFETPVTLTEDGKSYRPVLDETIIMEGTQKVNSTPVWNATRDSLYLKPEALLKGQTTYSVQVKSHWEVQQNSGWTAVAQNGQTLYGTSSSSFTTGVQSDITRLIADNIAYTYPVQLQYYFLQDEYSKGYLILKTGMQNALLTLSAGEQLEARITSPGKSEIKTAVQFDASTLTLAYEMPALETQTIYHLRVVRIAVGGNEKEIYSTDFRTSKYNTFLQKMNSFTNKKGYSWMTYTGVDEVKSQFENAAESFDDAEIKTDSLTYPNYKGMYYSSGLFQFEAQAGNPLYDNANNRIYKDLPGSGLSISYRSAASVGIPPKYAIYMNQGKTNPIRHLSATEISQNSVTFASVIPVLIYNLNLVIDRDFYDLRMQAFNHPQRETNPYIKRLATENLAGRASFGDYKVKLKYRLPGMNMITSEKEIIIDYKY